MALMILAVVKPATTAQTQYRSSLVMEISEELASKVCRMFNVVNATACLTPISELRSMMKVVKLEWI